MIILFTSYQIINTENTGCNIMAQCPSCGAGMSPLATKCRECDAPDKPKITSTIESATSLNHQNSSPEELIYKQLQELTLAVQGVSSAIWVVFFFIPVFVAIFAFLLW